MPGYVYRGNQPDKTTKPRQKKEFDPSKCGTYAGYRQHTNHGVPHCDRCRAALSEYVAERKKAMAG